MDNDSQVLQQMIGNHVPPTWGNDGLGHDVPLGPGGLGMDSVSIVMLLLECESRWGIAFPATLLEQPLTLGRLVNHLRLSQG